MSQKSKSSHMMTQVRKELEQVLRKHVRRLSGVTHELSNIFLSLDLLTLTSTILLVEREKEVQDPESDVKERYKEETILMDLAELGLDNEKELKRTLQLMVAKNYFAITEKQELAAVELAFKLSNLFSLIFPNMVGLSLIVYFNQIMDEVLDDRKTTELAVAQIDKTLKTQGVSIVKGRSKSPSKPSKPSKASKASKQPIKSKKTKWSGLDRLRKAKHDKAQQAEQDSGSSGGMRILSSSGSWIQMDETKPKEKIEPTEQKEQVEQVIDSPEQEKTMDTTNEEESKEMRLEIKREIPKEMQGVFDPNEYEKISSEKIDPEKISSETIDSVKEKPSLDNDNYSTVNLQDDINELFGEKTDTRPESPKSEAQEPASQQDPEPEKPEAQEPASQQDPEPEKPEAQEPESQQDPEPEAQETEILQEPEPGKIEDQQPEIPKEPEPGQDDKNLLDDDEVAKQISSMNQSDNLVCPICNSKSIIEMETSQNKVYFSCNRKDCKFISWEKPYNIVCPECGNPFLVKREIKGKTNYCCPKADCHHCQTDLIQQKLDVDTLPDSPDTNEGNKKPKKRKKIVRRVLVRRK